MRCGCCLKPKLHVADLSHEGSAGFVLVFNIGTFISLNGAASVLYSVQAVLMIVSNDICRGVIRTEKSFVHFFLVIHSMRNGS